MLRAPIRLGLQIPNFNFPGVSEEDLFERLSDIATTAESSGFDTVLVMDHLHQIRGVGPPENWMLEGNTILAALAARTSSVNLSLLVGAVTYRNPALHAKITTTLDVISGGRAIHGIGAGWNVEEATAYGYEFPPLGERFERLEDHLNIARAMFTEERATYEGKHHSVHEAFNNPRPIRGDIPIMIGGSGEKKTLRMVAQYADASNFFGDADRLRHLSRRARGPLRAARTRPRGDHKDPPRHGDHRAYPGGGGRKARVVGAGNPHGPGPARDGAHRRSGHRRGEGERAARERDRRPHLQLSRGPRSRDRPAPWGDAGTAMLGRP